MEAANPKLMTGSLARLLVGAYWAKRQGSAGLARSQRTRLAEIVAFARRNSPFYADLYRGLPERIEEPALLPVTNKKQLMACFDDWVTDRNVTIARAQAFAEEPELIGEWFLGKYTVATTSGTTGTRGIFLMDAQSLAITAVLSARVLGSWLSVGDVLRILTRGGRLAMVMASGGHFASAVAAARLRKGWLGAKITRALSVHRPLPELVDCLNGFLPVILAPYASMATLLADEQEAGRLRINPVLVALAAEGLLEGEYARIARAFGAKIGNTYAATECPFLSYSCEHGWLHVNSDWVLLEAVDREGRPTPSGEPSHTVLISNLANHVQPILRYDLGDSVVQRPDPCPCGNPLPALRVQGRTADVITFQSATGARVPVAPLAFGLIVDAVRCVELAQFVQTGPASLQVRLRYAPESDHEQAWRAVHAGITGLLRDKDLQNVTIERAEEPPQQSPGGKFREVIPMS